MRRTTNWWRFHPSAAADERKFDGWARAGKLFNELVQPASVIASHVNEAATKGGKVLPGTKTETFIKAVKVPVHVPLSGKTMEFDSSGKCAAGC